MDAKTLRALKGSIEKWRQIVDLEGEDWGNSNCPLCHLFRCCGDCPVRKITHDGCGRTPFSRWVHHHEKEHFSHQTVECEECHKIAQAEWEFLKSLLPKQGAK